mgnify:CR=1 FL=1
MEGKWQEANWRGKGINQPRSMIYGHECICPEGHESNANGITLQKTDTFDGGKMAGGQLAR